LRDASAWRHYCPSVCEHHPRLVARPLAFNENLDLTKDFDEGAADAGYDVNFPRQVGPSLSDVEALLGSDARRRKR
jgi:hypothetical protein